MLHRAFLWLCRFVTRQECFKRREQRAELMRWVDGAHVQRREARVRLDDALSQ